MKTLKRTISFMLVLMLVLGLMPGNYAKAATEVTGTITEVQKYGNVVMDIKPKALLDAGYEAGDLLNVQIGETTLTMPFCTSYSDVDTGSLLIRNDEKNDLLIVAINMGNFSTKYNAKVGDTIKFSLKEAKAYLAEYLLRQLKRTNERSDYASDSIFANFRSVVTTGIKPGVLYRGSSPINNEIGRAAYSNALAEAVGVKTVLNLADNAENIEKYIAADDFNSAYYKKLVDKKQVKLLNMDVDVAGKDFSKKLASGLKFMAGKKAPYMIHCTEGKDRAGFVSAVLEALMGAGMDEIVADYMTTYENYYKVEKDSEQYKKIAESNIVNSMTEVVFGLPKGSDISKVNVAKATEKYLKKIGVSKKTIAKLKKNLAGKSVFRKPSIRGKVTEIEKYGHAVTNITIDKFNKKGFKLADNLAVVFDNGFVLEAPYLDGYLVNNGMPLVRAYKGQTNIAICINYGKLNEVAGVKPGDKFTIFMSRKQGYAEAYSVRKLERTNNRADYASDEVFANFREIKLGKIAAGTLYRSSSPVNNELGRASYADKLLEGAKVATVVNLADSKEKVEGFTQKEDFKSPYYANLFKNGKVITLNLGLAFTSKEFKEGIAKGVQFMADNAAPYHFHCLEGKDRAGYMAVFLESLMGATKEEIIDDYMKSYENYYKVTKDSKQYEYIKNDVVMMMESIAGGKDLSVEKLTKGAEDMLLANGVKAEDIARLKEKLSGNKTAMTDGFKVAA